MTHDPDRDRDERGRARNAHPRDRLGRPLSRDRGWPFQAHEGL